mmetsp:Transcript_32444/g.79689  ORF Transcript_32444/g.79689 Transcript_32444/m.79689 type:complete len:83 (-) Transcript_32444:159-407(-)
MHNTSKSQPKPFPDECILKKKNKITAESLDVADTWPPCNVRNSMIHSQYSTQPEQSKLAAVAAKQEQGIVFGPGGRLTTSLP